MYIVNIKVDGVGYVFTLDSGLALADLIKGTTGNIESLSVRG